MIDNINADPDYGDEPPAACLSRAFLGRDSSACGGTPGHAGKHAYRLPSVTIEWDGRAERAADATPGQAAYGQAAYEAYHAVKREQGALDGSYKPYERLSTKVGARWEAAGFAAAQERPVPEPDVALASIAADRNQLRIALERIALGTAGDPSVAADRALTASRENARREPSLGALEPSPALAELAAQWEARGAEPDRDRVSAASWRIAARELREIAGGAK